MPAKEAEILGKYIPAASIDYCFDLWKIHRIQLTITRPRKSIYGNYAFRDGVHRITVNGNLSKEAFLVTYLHEVAHLLVRKKYLNRVKPHGKEWQSTFAELMNPVLHTGNFREEILHALHRHLQNPAATSCSDPLLHALLNNEIPSENQRKTESLKPGDYFRFQGRRFQWVRKLRSRCEVRCPESGRLYRLSASALVDVMEVVPEEFTFRKITVGNIPAGQAFFLENRIFRKIEVKRTRVLCEEISSKIKFLIGAEREILPEYLIKDPSAATGAQ